jgi:RecA/RadA recombinase
MQYNAEFQTADMLVHKYIGTGITALDRLLRGGYECGLMHLFYGNHALHNALLRAAVWSQMPRSRGGSDSPAIIIDSSNMLDVQKLADYASELELNIEQVMNRIFISRAFNSSQTYDLIINHLDEYLERIPAKLLLVPGLPDLFISEGLDSQRSHQSTHATAYLMAMTLERGLVTLISTTRSLSHGDFPPVGTALATNAQVHIMVEHTPMRTLYTLTKHPSLSTRTESQMTYPAHYGVTLPLDHFFENNQPI